jgi:hypothetical protein
MFVDAFVIITSVSKIFQQNGKKLLTGKFAICIVESVEIKLIVGAEISNVCQNGQPRLL